MVDKKAHPKSGAACEEPVIVYECSANYDPTVMDQMMSDLYIQYTTTLNSDQFGMVGPRPRRYGILLLKTDVQANFSSLKNVLPMFFRDTGDALCIQAGIWAGPSTCLVA